MPLIRLMVAISLDGFIADEAGGVDWLHPYEDVDWGFADFFSSIGTILSGRKTYDKARSFDAWPYGDKRMVVLTRRPLDDGAPDRVEAYTGDLAALIADLKRISAGDIWVLGGAEVAREIMRLGLMDRIELGIIPVLLGRGIPLFGDTGQQSLRLLSQRGLSNGILLASYATTGKQ
ncbi:dihydrofolate reductase family protein [Lacibacterium aquatile]|uniref:Dihydrofolate reductase family protein n=1 Tax=Lacibacterium aquatile TaxID=1168082 RepID=A0ABW5DWK4_9PROT